MVGLATDSMKTIRVFSLISVSTLAASVVET
jgi:hypothetical protein